MRLRLHLNNFQTWRDAALDITGLTVVVGPSNVGKSSFFRALYGLLRGELSASQVRIGARSLTVALEADGHTYEATRTAKTAAVYTVDDKEKYSKLGSGKVPDQVRDLRMGAVEVGKIGLDPIFSSQHDSKFLIQDMEPIRLNAVLGAFSSTDKFEYGKRQANIRIQQLKAEQKTLSEEVRDAEERRHTLDSEASELTPVVDALSSVEALTSSINLALEEVETTEQMMRELSRVRFTIESLAVPDTASLVEIESKIDAAEEAANRILVLRYTHRVVGYFDSALNSLTSAKLLGDVVLALNDAAAAVQRLEVARAASQGLDAALSTVAEAIPLCQKHIGLHYLALRSEQAAYPRAALARFEKALALSKAAENTHSAVVLLRAAADARSSHKQALSETALLAAQESEHAVLVSNYAHLVALWKSFSVAASAHANLNDIVAKTNQINDEIAAASVVECPRCGAKLGV